MASRKFSPINHLIIQSSSFAPMSAMTIIIKKSQGITINPTKYLIVTALKLPAHCKMIVSQLQNHQASSSLHEDSSIRKLLSNPLEVAFTPIHRWLPGRQRPINWNRNVMGTKLFKFRFDLPGRSGGPSPD